MAIELEQIERDILQLLVDRKKRCTLAQIAVDLPYTGSEIGRWLDVLAMKEFVVVHTGSDQTWIISLDGCRAVGGC